MKSVSSEEANKQLKRQHISFVSKFCANAQLFRPKKDLKSSVDCNKLSIKLFRNQPQDIFSSPMVSLHQSLTTGLETCLGLTLSIAQISLGTSTHSLTSSRLGRLMLSLVQILNVFNSHLSLGTWVTNYNNFGLERTSIQWELPKITSHILEKG